MSSKTKTFFSCGSCGAQSPKWMGRCPDCGEWNTFVEERIVPEKTGAERLVYYPGP
ncbi:MAG: hypothetical protein HZA01_09760, partial [Nitrospinae bacterium]|nr:hypothetical protein [Nitrospinota bacterium]